MGGVIYDVSDFQRFSRAMRRASKSLGPQLRKAEKEAANVVADRAREIAAEHSDKVAATIKTYTNGARFGVQAGSDDVPLAALLELGNHSSTADILRSRRGGTFRHPVFATGDRSTWHWNDEHPQKMHPYLGPAANEKTDEAVDLVVRGINRVLNENGIQMEGA